MEIALFGMMQFCHYSLIRSSGNKYCLNCSKIFEVRCGKVIFEIAVSNTMLRHLS